VVGYCCTSEGQIADESRVDAIRNWGPCKTLLEVCAFLGMVGVMQIFIRNFAHRAHHFTVRLVGYGFQLFKSENRKYLI
jgi:hypothetical protein